MLNSSNATESHLKSDSDDVLDIVVKKIFYAIDSKVAMFASEDGCILQSNADSERIIHADFDNIRSYVSCDDVEISKYFPMDSLTLRMYSIEFAWTPTVTHPTFDPQKIIRYTSDALIRYSKTPFDGIDDMDGRKLSTEILKYYNNIYPVIPVGSKLEDHPDPFLQAIQRVAHQT